MNNLKYYSIKCIVQCIIKWLKIIYIFININIIFYKNNNFNTFIEILPYYLQLSKCLSIKINIMAIKYENIKCQRNPAQKIYIVIYYVYNSKKFSPKYKTHKKNKLTTYKFMYNVLNFTNDKLNHSQSLFNKIYIVEHLIIRLCKVFSFIT